MLLVLYALFLVLTCAMLSDHVVHPSCCCASRVVADSPYVSDMLRQHFSGNFVGNDRAHHIDGKRPRECAPPNCRCDVDNPHTYDRVHGNTCNPCVRVCCCCPVRHLARHPVHRPCCHMPRACDCPFWSMCLDHDVYCRVSLVWPVVNASSMLMTMNYGHPPPVCIPLRP